MKKLLLAVVAILASRGYALDIDALAYGVSSTNPDNASSIQSALSDASAQGGGVVRLPAGVLMSGPISLPRYVILAGEGIGATELQLVSGTNADFITSENFNALTGSGLHVYDDSRVPSWMGLEALRVNGNKGSNSSGRCVAFYGSAQIMDKVEVYGCASDNIYTEYAAGSGQTGWQSQEEGFFGSIVTRDSNGNGWTYKGPHDGNIADLISHNNAGWGFYSSTNYVAGYDGSLDHFGLIHTYANAGGQGSSFNANAVGDTLLADGDSTIWASGAAVKVANVSAFNAGIYRNAVEMNGANQQIANLDIQMHASAGNYYALVLGGHGNAVGKSFIYDNSPGVANGVYISGYDNAFTNTYIEGFGGVSKSAITLANGSNTITGQVVSAKTAFNYPAGTGGGNTVNLNVWTNSGQVPVAGQGPQWLDDINVRSNGSVWGRTSCQNATTTGAISLTTTTEQTITIPHYCLYTPALYNVTASLLQYTSGVSNYRVDKFMVSSVDATNVYVKVKLGTASTTTGAKADVGISVRF